MEKTIYNFEAKSLAGKDVELSKYKGKVVLVVNTASECGYTPQFDGLQKLYEKYAEKGLAILGFPCNQFGNQEPGGEKEISECLVNYGVTFDMFDKIEVNGSGTHPLFKYLKKELSGVLSISSIKWNFYKFLVDKNGVPVKRFNTRVKPHDIEADIQKLLDA